MEFIFKVLSFRLRPCSIYKHSFGTLVYFEIRITLGELLPLKLAENAFSHQLIPLKGTIFWKLYEKPFDLAPLGASYFLRIGWYSGLQAVGTEPFVQ